jgi:hypothetical protein
VGRGRCSSPELIVLIDQLLEDFTDAEVAEQLNGLEWRTYEGKPFAAARVVSLRRYHQLKTHSTRLGSARPAECRGSGVGLWSLAVESAGKHSWPGDGQGLFPCIGSMIKGQQHFRHLTSMHR